MAAEGVDTRTGEVVALPVKYDPKEYLATLSKNDGLSVQKQLSAAYDAAVAALIGPNDVQKADGREFKKKSAWRKLARYFNISVEIVKVEREVLEGRDFLATVTARAVAPWGQSYEEVGACCTDEATGRRVITVADAIATASTRASNRAVSNLIAMGEVSAEEIGERKPYGTNDRQRVQPPKPDSASDDPGAFKMPFGKTKGTPLSQMDPEDLRNAIQWVHDKAPGKFGDFVDAARKVLAGIQADAKAMEQEEPQDEPNPGDFGDDDLPF